MKPMRFMIHLALAAILLGSIPAAKAEPVTEATARLVAENYIRLTIVRDGAWGRFDEARVLSVEPFRATTRDLGWFCHVEPTGYILVALHVDMMPVHAYSNRSDLDPSENGGMAAFFRAKLEGKYTAIEAKLGRAIAPTDDLRPILERSYRDSWSALADPAFDPTSYRQSRKNRSAGMDYQEGETMLLSTWDQSPPYNDDCPDRGCSWETFDHFNANGWAGCVATAMAQMLRHHNWPPAGTNAPDYEDPYDWPNMLNKYVYDGAGWFTDENGTPATQAQIDAVAEISREMGMSVSMDYGCSGSGAHMEDCEEAMETHFFIHDGCQVLDRSDYTFDRWYELYQAEFDANRPAGIGIPDHMVVGDGWRIENIGGVDWRQIHVVYGWNGTHDAWYSPDDITGDPDDTMLTWSAAVLCPQLRTERNLHIGRKHMAILQPRCVHRRGHFRAGALASDSDAWFPDHEHRHDPHGQDRVPGRSVQQHASLHERRSRRGEADAHDRRDLPHQCRRTGRVLLGGAGCAAICGFF